LKKLRPDFQVESAGLQIAIPVSEEVKLYLTKETADKYLKKVPEALGSKNLREYDLIIGMDQRHKDGVLALCPECERKVVVWNIEDPYFMDREGAERIYREIEKRVAELAESL